MLLPASTGLGETVPVMLTSAWPAAATTTVVLAELLLWFGSGVEDPIEAVVVIEVPPAVPAGTAAVMVNTPLPPAANAARVQFTIPVPPIGGVEQAQPAAGVRDWNVLGPATENIFGRRT